MTLEQIKEQVIRSIQAGMELSGSRFEPEAVEDLIRIVRLELLISFVNGSKAQAMNPHISPVWAQTYETSIVAGDQDPDADFLVFSKPRTAQINEHFNGVLFVGKKKFARAFTQVRSWEQASMAQDMGEIYPNGGEHVLDNGNQFVVFGNPSLKSITSRIIAAVPEEVPGFNEYTDHYPIPDLVIPTLILAVRDRFLTIAQKEVPNLTQSGNDVTPPKISK